MWGKSGGPLAPRSEQLKGLIRPGLLRIQVLLYYWAQPLHVGSLCSPPIPGFDSLQLACWNNLRIGPNLYTGENSCFELELMYGVIFSIEVSTCRTS